MRTTHETNSEPSRQRSSFLDYCYELPSKMRFKGVILFLLVILGVFLLVRAIKQYVPEVQKINVSIPQGQYLSGVNYVDIEAILFDSRLDKEVKNSIGVKGGQFFSFSGIVKNGECESSKKPDYVPVGFNRHGSISIEASGPDFKPLYPIGEGVNFDDCSPMGGIGSVRASDKKHRYDIEYFTSNENSRVEVAIRGDGIFFDGRSYWKKKNPYIAFYLTFEGISFEDNANAYINMYYQRTNKDRESKQNKKLLDSSDYTHPYDSPINIVSVYPEPDYYTPSLIGFKKNLPEVLEHGLYVVMEDYSKRKKNDLALFLCSVFLGVVVSFVVQLIVSWTADFRRWKKMKENKE